MGLKFPPYWNHTRSYNVFKEFNKNLFQKNITLGTINELKQR